MGKEVGRQRQEKEGRKVKEEDFCLRDNLILFYPSFLRFFFLLLAFGK